MRRAGRSSTPDQEPDSNRVVHDHPGGRIVVFTHGGVIGASSVAFADSPIGKGYRLTAEVKNTSITEWRHTGEEWAA